MTGTPSACLFRRVGSDLILREKRRGPLLEAITEADHTGLKETDRLTLAKQQMERVSRTAARAAVYCG
jgi:hypothetical protein